MPSLSVIIPTWNRGELLESVLGNLAQQTRKPEQVIVIDNGSTEDIPGIAARYDAELIRFPENRGFAEAVNAGVKRASGDWVLILNNDVSLERNWIEVLLRTAVREGAAFAAGKLLQTSRGRYIDGTWDLLSRGAHAWRCGYGRPDGETWNVKRKICFAPMTAALFRRNLFDAVGLLDGRFEAYYEDVDFGVRCALAGFDGIYDPMAVATHRSKETLGKNSGRVLYLTARNQIFLLAKHYPARTLWHFAWPILVGQTLSLIGAAQQGHFWPALRGTLEGIRRWRSVRGATSHFLVEQTLAESEREIHSLQREVGFDPYWRLYFSLVRSL
jgi:GT2 family glycosyltransferase